MKKLVSLALAVLMCFSALMLASCSDGEKTDWEKIKEKGEFTVAYTLYEPFNYEVDGKLTGFDTEFAEMVAAKLGVKVKFQLITWGNKYIELNSGSVDCLWNAFTANCADDDGIQRSEKVDFSVAYMDNAQCVVVKSDLVDSIKSTDDLKGKTCAAEGGSAGESYAKSVTDADKVIAKDAMTDAFTELAAGTVDFIVVDVYLANTLCGTGDYADLARATAIEIPTEDYAVGFRKGSDFKTQVDKAINELATSGELQALAEKYGLNLCEALDSLKK